MLASALFNCCCETNQRLLITLMLNGQLIGVGSIWTPSGVYHTQVITGIGCLWIRLKPEPRARRVPGRVHRPPATRESFSDIWRNQSVQRSVRWAFTPKITEDNQCGQRWRPPLLENRLQLAEIISISFPNGLALLEAFPSKRPQRTQNISVSDYGYTETETIALWVY